MNNTKTIMFFGCDTRFQYAASGFEKLGYTCSFCDCDTSLHSIKCDYAALPVRSFTEDGRLNAEYAITADDLFSLLARDTIIFGGMLSDFIFRVAREYNLSVYDYAAREEFCILNAIPTAEAAIMIASDLTKRTVFGADYTIVGYGRIGKALSKRLYALGGNVTVTARSSEALTNARIEGYGTIALRDYLMNADNADVCFNTVPYRIIGDKCIENHDSTIFIDLASNPGGFTEEAEQILGKRLVKALSLPGKFYPETAGKIVFETLNNLICEIGG